MSDPFDAIVVGGGPSGSSFALAAARLGKKIALIEKDDVPGRRVCGGVLSPKCWKYIEFLGVSEVISKIPFQVLRGMRVEHESGNSIHIPFPDQEIPTRVVDRSLFDATLWRCAQAAGVLALERAVAREITFKQGLWILKVQHNTEEHLYSSRFIVGADGRNSFVGQQLGIKVSRRGKSTCFQYRLRRHDFEPNDLHFFIFEDGYCGLSVDGDGVAHVDVISLKGGVTDSVLLERVFLCGGHFVEKLKKAEFFEERPLARSPIGSGFREFPKHHQASLVGDAQAWFEPFTGEGIKLALESALKQVACLEQKNVSCHVMPKVSHSNLLIAQILKSSLAARSFISILNYVPAIARMMARDVLS